MTEQEKILSKYQVDEAAVLFYIKTTYLVIRDSLVVVCLGVGSTVLVEGGVVSPFTVSVNVNFRLTRVFFVGVLLCDTIVLVYIQAADCTLNCLLYLDDYQIPYYLFFNVQPALRTLLVGARQSSCKINHLDCHYKVFCLPTANRARPSCS